MIDPNRIEKAIKVYTIDEIKYEGTNIETVCMGDGLEGWSNNITVYNKYGAEVKRRPTRNRRYKVYAQFKILLDQYTITGLQEVD